MDQPSAVLDASALLAWLRLEPGALAVRSAIDRTAAISVVNWAETLTKLVDLGQDPDEVRLKIADAGILGNDLLLWPLDEEMAMEIARLRAGTRSRGLSLGDRACIALGRYLRLPILTTDRSWKGLRLGAQVQIIR
jgi:ribonuclease VapC